MLMFQNAAENRRDATTPGVMAGTATTSATVRTPNHDIFLRTSNILNFVAHGIVGILPPPSQK